MDASSTLPITRLRLPRYSTHHDHPPIAGSSHNPDLLYADEDNDDAESTPRMGTSAILDRQSPRTAISPGLPASNPTARLRDIMARVPKLTNGSTPHASASRHPTLPSGSEPDSDLEPPQSILTASSFARESLKELFSHALREPGNTPRKNARPRRNSIDTSEVEASPRVEEERARYKAKRRTLSDEEAEKSRYIEPSAQFSRSPAATTFDALRQRLDRSTTMLLPLSQDEMVMDLTMPPSNSSIDPAMQLISQDTISSDTPPRATSTPLRTFHMSAHLNMHSNLLDQDSEMQNALQGMDSYESAPLPRHRHSTPSLNDNSTPTAPTPRPSLHGASPSRPLSWSSHSKSHSLHNLPLPVRRGSEDLGSSSSRASSSLSNADHADRAQGTRRGQLHERERGWNSPLPKITRSPGHPGKHDLTHRHSWDASSNGRESPAHRLSRKDSAASLASTDDGRSSSRASSVASRTDHKENVKTHERGHNKEREREWNRPHPKLARSSSSLSLNKSERIRKISTPSRPDSAASYLSPVRTTLQRHGSLNSLSSSRPSSPASSVSSKSFEDEIEDEIEHQRERNWNSPRPAWSNSRRSISPLPRSRPGSPAGTPAHMPSTMSRSRTNSTAHGDSLTVSSSGSRSKSPLGDLFPRPKSPMVQFSVDDKCGLPLRATSPVPPTLPLGKAVTDTDSRSRFGWSFPQHKMSLPPLELDHESPQKPPLRPSSRSSLHASSTTPTHIPVRSHRQNGHTPATAAMSVAERKKSHRRSVTEFTESIGPIPPRVEISESEELPPVPMVDSRHDFPNMSEDESRVVSSTPTAKPAALPPDVSAASRTEPGTDTYNGHPSQAHDHTARRESLPASQPHTPPATDSQTTLNLQTPPRRPQFHTPRAEFETPPPPQNMPDLPGPPSEEEQDQDDNDHTPLMPTREIEGDLTAMKTPCPPGAWLATPVPSRQFPPQTPAPPQQPLLPQTPAQYSLQTPVPPGGWVSTPAPATASRRRGSLLKVRFELESETASEGVVERSLNDDSLGSQNADSERGDHSQTSPSNGDASAASSAKQDETESWVEPPPTPPSLRERIRRKSTSIRVLDAYGREQIETELVAPVELDAAPEPTALPPPEIRHSTTTSRHKDVRTSPVTPRSRSTVRVVDAMGREIEDEMADDSFVSDTPLTHHEALSRMRDTLSSMRQELSDADRSTDNAIFDQRMYVALQERCKDAQAVRSRISKRLQVEQNAEPELKNNHTPSLLQTENGKTTLLSIGAVDERLSWNSFSWRFLAGCILIQLLLLVIMYRYSLVQARKLFLTTYYDPFYPDLHIHLFKPDTIFLTIPSCPSWSVSSIFSSFQRGGLRGVIVDAWTSGSCAVSYYLQATWTGWSHGHDTVSLPWPPT